MLSKESLRQKLALAVIGAIAVLGTLGSAPALAKTVGVVPPKKPAADCAAGSQWVHWTVANINGCRAKEGVGPLELPSNWGTLNATDQMFVLINLERVNRGLQPLVGTSPTLNALAQSGAAQGTDPSFPSGGFIGGGGLWAGGSSVIGAVDTWMYYDGPHGLDLNLACTSLTAPGCWLHRQIILWGGTGGPLVAGGGFSTAPGYASYAFEILSGYSTANLTFTWAHELQFFAHRPGLDPLNGHAANAKKKHRKHSRRRHHGRHRHTRHRHHHRHRNNSGSTLTISIG